MNLFVASRLSKLPVEKVSVAVLPYIGALTLAILIFTFFPSIATWLPRVLGYGG